MSVTSRATSSTTFKVAALSLTLALSSISLAPLSAAQIDPALEQTVSSDERVAPEGEEATLSEGHADFGPILLDAGSTNVELKIRDDSAHPPVWRDPSDVVFKVSDAAELTVPDDPAFEFTGAKPGDVVWVVPQTELAGVPWLGWNTQFPALVEAAESGIDLELAGYDGEGQLSLFLQNGGFEAPQKLWSTADEGPQPIYVDLNTHAHANWVFTEPGVHHVKIRAIVPLKNGEKAIAEDVLTFAIGDDTDVAEAHSSTFEGKERPLTNNMGSSTNQGLSSTTWLAIAGGLAGIVALIAVVAFIRRRR